MILQRLFSLVSLSLVAALAYGQSESMRPLFVKENKFPELHEFEVNVLGFYAQYEETGKGDLKRDKDNKRGIYSFVPQVRFGAYENLTLYANLPLRAMKSDLKNKTYTGLDDITIGAELLAYEYIYRYPWVVPYAEVSFPTGNDDDMLPIQKTDTIVGYSQGKVDAVFGIAVGTTVYDELHYIIDGRYDVNNGDDGKFSGAVCMIWDISDQFSVLGEVQISQEPDDNDAYDGIPVHFNGGISYTPFEGLRFTAYGGAAANCRERGHGGLKIAYSF